MSKRAAVALTISLVLGLVLGRLNPFQLTNINLIITYLLYVLVFVAGLAIGVDLARGSIKASANLALVGAVQGMLVLVAGLVSGFLTFKITGSPCLRCLLIGGVASGWYTLAGPLASQLNPVMGLAVFIANMLRETIHILFYPWLSRVIGRSAISVGGATTMDTGLPVVVMFGEREDYVVAVVQGLTITLCAPIIGQIIIK